MPHESSVGIAWDIKQLGRYSQHMEVKSATKKDVLLHDFPTVVLRFMRDIGESSFGNSSSNRSNFPRSKPRTYRFILGMESLTPGLFIARLVDNEY